MHDMPSGKSMLNPCPLMTEERFPGSEIKPVEHYIEQESKHQFKSRKHGKEGRELHTGFDDAIKHGFRVVEYDYHDVSS